VTETQSMRLKNSGRGGENKQNSEELSKYTNTQSKRRMHGRTAP